MSRSVGFHLPYLRACWFCFMFMPGRHSFALLIDKQFSRKATLMFQDVIVWTFPRNIPKPLLFSPKSAQKFSRQNLQLLVHKKAYCPLTAPGRAIRFFLDLSATSQHRHDLSHIIIIITIINNYYTLVLTWCMVGAIGGISTV